MNLVGIPMSQGGSGFDLDPHETVVVVDNEVVALVVSEGWETVSLSSVERCRKAVSPSSSLLFVKSLHILYKTSRDILYSFGCGSGSGIQRRVARALPLIFSA